MMVVAIIGILASLAVVTFARARVPAVDRSAQALLTSGVQAVHVVAADDHPFSTISLADLHDAEPAVAWRNDSAAPEAAQHEISVAAGTAAGTDYLILSTHTANGDCLAVRNTEREAPMYERVAGDVCPANAFDPSFGWVERWPPR
jgi:hypothetical protein